MRILLTLLLSTAAVTARADWEPVSRQEIARLPGGGQLVERDVRRDGQTVRLSGVFFTEKQARLAVLENAAGASLGQAMADAGALAGTNGAYFQADMTPVGLMIAQGKKVHPFERAKLLSGIFAVTHGRPRIVRSAKFTATPGDSDALQAGPFLVEAGRPTAGLNAIRAARRTVVATDGAGRWALLSFSSVTLADAAAILATRKIWPDFHAERALNLDGGSSTGLWAAGTARPYYQPEFSTVRNFIGVFPR